MEILRCASLFFGVFFPYFSAGSYKLTIKAGERSRKAVLICVGQFSAALNCTTSFGGEVRGIKT